MKNLQTMNVVEGGVEFVGLGNANVQPIDYTRSYRVQDRVAAANAREVAAFNNIIADELIKVVDGLLFCVYDAAKAMKKSVKGRKSMVKSSVRLFNNVAGIYSYSITNAACSRGIAMGIQASLFYSKSTRGNYFSDYLMDNIADTGVIFERTAKDTNKRMDGFYKRGNNVDIIEFKTGEVYRKTHMRQVLGYADDVFNEFGNDVNVTVHLIYSDQDDEDLIFNVIPPQ